MVHKASTGGWSELQFQHAVEETWHRNAGDTAAAAAELADEIGAEVLVVGGDVRAVQLLVDQLPARWRDRVVRTEAGSRAPGADNGGLDEITLRSVAEVAERHTRSALDRFLIQYGNDLAAGTGLEAVVAGLQRGQVDTVLMVDDPSATGELWIGPEPTQLAMAPDQLRMMGVESAPAHPRRRRDPAGDRHDRRTVGAGHLRGGAAERRGRSGPAVRGREHPPPLTAADPLAQAVTTRSAAGAGPGRDGSGQGRFWSGRFWSGRDRADRDSRLSSRRRR